MAGRQRNRILQRDIDSLRDSDIVLHQGHLPDNERGTEVWVLVGGRTECQDATQGACPLVYLTAYDLGWESVQQLDAFPLPIRYSNPYNP